MIPKFRAWDKESQVMFNVARFDFADYTVYSHLFACEGYLGEDLEIMQSTGLKDKNGVEIFEGDILKGPMDFGPAGYVESVAPVNYHKIDGYQLHYFLLEHTEVIGNVYEDKNIKIGPVEE
ncbi:YopX family protein [Staphylococcus nepalensis]|uniref:YopX family protein n=1 Tax=Staphylococcus nepalensis TaxID=214473 RepID=UPI001E565635|nr:YopX family protein [Staphylococcus nepalensis]MCD8892903.1 YopX family protein [Staphylococcus nepalensis]